MTHGHHLLSSWRGGDKVNWMDGKIVILASYNFNFIRVHVDNQVLYPINNKSIPRIHYFVVIVERTIWSLRRLITIYAGCA